jgi:hypothetical protein
LSAKDDNETSTETKAKTFINSPIDLVSGVITEITHNTRVTVIFTLTVS